MADSGGFFDNWSQFANLNNPAFLGLLSGLGQAAQPSRVPLGFGATMGMAAQGLMQGQNAALDREGKQMQLMQGGLGLNQTLGAINYYRQKSGLPPLDPKNLMAGNFGLNTPSAQPASAIPPGDFKQDDTQSAAPLGVPVPNKAAPLAGMFGSDASQTTPAIRTVESNNNPNAVSPVGATGPMQVMPTTSANPGFGVQPAQNNSTAENDRVGADYYKSMVQRYGGNQTLGLIAYNWGPGNTDKWIAGGAKFNKLPPETQQYLGRVAVAMLPQGAGGQVGTLPPSASPTQQQPQHNPMQDIASAYDQIGMFNPQAAMEGQLSLMKPQVLREGGASWAYDPATGKMEQLAFQPKIPQGTELGPDGSVHEIPGSLQAQADASVAGSAGTRATEQFKTGLENSNTLVKVYDPQSQSYGFRTRQEVLDRQSSGNPYIPVQDNGNAIPGSINQNKTQSGVVIPPQPKIISSGGVQAGPSAGDEATQAAGAATVKTWFDNLPSNVQASQRMEATADALRKIESGAWQEDKADIAKNLIASGFGADFVNNLLQTDPAQAQIVLKNSFGTALNSMKGVTNRVTQNEIFAAQKALANPALQPEANKAILAQGLGIARYNVALPNDWLKAQQAGWTNPLQFQSWWMAQPQNSLESFIKKAGSDIGMLKGERPSSNATALPANARMQLKQGVNTTFGNGQVWTLQNGNPVRVQ